MFVQITYNKILYCKGTDVNKTSASKECTICHSYCILDNGFKFQSYVSNGCHDISVMSIDISINDVYWYWFWVFTGFIIVVLLTELAKVKVKSHLKNADLTENL